MIERFFFLPLLILVYTSCGG